MWGPFLFKLGFVVGSFPLADLGHSFFRPLSDTQRFVQLLPQLGSIPTDYAESQKSETVQSLHSNDARVSITSSNHSLAFGKDVSSAPFRLVFD